MKSILITLLLLFCFCLVAFSQSNDEQAREKYQEAKTAYDNKEFQNTIRLLCKTQDLLGSTNIRIQPLLIKSLAKTNAWKYIKKEVDKYLALKPDTTLIEYSDVIKIAGNIVPNLNKDKAAYQKIIANPTNNGFEDYFTNFPYGLHIDGVHWEKAKYANTLEGYNQYLEQYPRGLHVNEAKEGINFLENDAYKRVVKLRTVAECYYYLYCFPNGIHKKEVDDLKLTYKEEELYQDAIKRVRASTILYYLKEYPNGKYIEEVKSLLCDGYFNDAEEYMRKGNEDYIDYSLAKSDYENYLKECPKGEKATLAKENIKQCKILYKIGLAAKESIK